MRSTPFGFKLVRTGVGRASLATVIEEIRIRAEKEAGQDKRISKFEVYLSGAEGIKFDVYTKIEYKRKSSSHMSHFR